VLLEGTDSGHLEAGELQYDARDLLVHALELVFGDVGVQVCVSILAGRVSEDIMQISVVGGIIHYDETETQRVLGGGAPVIDVGTETKVIFSM
jgi:hypothetical protein